MAVTVTINGDYTFPTEVGYSIKNAVMAYGARDVQSVVLSGFFDIEQYGPQSLESAFNGCWHLTSVDMSELDTTGVTNMSKMFMDCQELETLDVSNFNMSSVTDISNMFSQCLALKSLDLSSWDTSNVTSMAYTFWQCTSIMELDLSNWNTSNVTNMNNMFSHSWVLHTITLGDWDTSSVGDCSYMFASCDRLANIYSDSAFDLSNAYSSLLMFQYSYSLPNYDSTKLGGDMAKPVADGGYFNPVPTPPPVPPTPSDYYKIIYRDKDIKVTYFQGNEGDKIYRN